MAGKSNGKNGKGKGVGTRRKKKGAKKGVVIGIVIVVLLLAVALGVCLSIESLRTPIVTYAKRIYVTVVSVIWVEEEPAEQGQQPQSPSQNQGGDTSQGQQGQQGQTPAPTPHTYDEAATYVGTPTVADLGDQLSFHFLELGNKASGDCSLVKIGDVEILIDAGSIQSSAGTIVPYVRQYCTDGVLEYVIVTHAHQDHIAGFVGTSKYAGVFDSFSIGTIIQFAGTTKQDEALYKNYCAERDEAVERGATLYTARQCVEQTDGAQRVYTLATGVTMEILDSYYYYNGTSNENNYSVCALFSAGDNHYLFTGDLEEEGEKKLVERNTLPKVELFKGGHHGSETANSAELMAVIQPKVVCVCCCCGTPEYSKDPDKMFPSQAFFDHVLPYTELVFVTSFAVWEDPTEQTYKYDVASCNGNIVVLADLTIYCSYSDVPVPYTQWFATHRKRGEN